MTWTSEKYFAKAQAYWERATSRGRDDDSFLLNVCFFVEFVARGTICHINPALNAASDLESLLFACGQAPRSPAKTADLTDILKRLHRFIPALTDNEMAKVRTLIDARNGELHGDTAELPQANQPSFMPSVYSFIVKVAEFAEQDLTVLLGPGDAQVAKQTANAMAKDRSRRVTDLIRVCKERFFSLPPDEQKQKREASATDVISVVLATGHHVKYMKCPSCAQKGQLVASPVGRSSPFLRGNEILQEVRVIPIHFTCKCCGLEIKGLDELMSAGFDHEYCTLDDVDPLEHFSIDPLDHIDLDAIVREYNNDIYEYQDE